MKRLLMISLQILLICCTFPNHVFAWKLPYTGQTISYTNIFGEDSEANVDAISSEINTKVINPVKAMPWIPLLLFDEYLQQPINLDYVVTIDNPSNHEMKVKLTIDNINQDTVTVTRPVAYMPALPAISQISAIDEQGGNLAYQIQESPQNGQIGSQRITITCRGKRKIIISYAIDLTNNIDSPHWCLGAEGGIFESQICFFQPQKIELNSALISFELPSNWVVASRLPYSNGSYILNVKDLVLYATEDYFLWGPIAFGNFNIIEKPLTTAAVRIAVQADNMSIQNEIAQVVYSALQYGEYSIGSLTDTLNEYLIYAYIPWENTNPNWFGQARDHILGDFRGGIGDQNIEERFREIAHTVFHTFFAHYDLAVWKTIKPGEFEEGLIQYFAIKSLKEKGIWDNARMHQELTGWYSDYQNFILGTQYNVPLFPSSNWTNFPNDPLNGYYHYYGIQFIFWFEKEPLVFWMLDEKIRELTGNSKGFEDVWKYFYDNNPGSQNSPLTYEDILQAVNWVSGFNFSYFFGAYISGNDELPLYIDNGILKIENSDPTPIPLM